MTVYGTTIQFQPAAQCSDCDYCLGSGRASRAVAKRHAQESGHTVYVEVLKRTVYKREDAAP